MSHSQDARTDAYRGTPERIPLEILFGNATAIAPILSPDGTEIAFRAPLGGVMNVFVAPAQSEIRSGSILGTPVTNDTDRGIRNHLWSKDGKHIFYLQDAGGDENWRLYSVEIRTGDTKCLTPYEKVQVQIVAYDSKHPDVIMIAMNLENPKARDLYALTPKTGDIRMVAKNEGDIARWVLDAGLQPRAAVRNLSDGSKELLVCKDQDPQSAKTLSTPTEWDTPVVWNPDDAVNSYPLYFSADGKSIYLIDSRNRNTAALVRRDLSDNHTEELLGDSDFDIIGAMPDKDKVVPLAATLHRDKRESVVVDESVGEDFRKIQELCGGESFVASRDDRDVNWVIGSASDTGPVSYFLYQRDTKEATFLFQSRPDLGDYELAPMNPISITSRDGLMLHGYLTLPVGVSPTKLPLVLLVHGGPHGRDVFGYHPMVQWLANRGYACLQVNFRGSVGYGKAFVNAAHREWGGKMHDDLVDGVLWATREGIADPKRIAIFGGSYGGYAALVGATFTPDLFCCAVDMMGPSNLVTLMSSMPPQWATNVALRFHRSVGHPERDEEYLKARSPLFKVDNIKIPILIAQGANDPRVKQQESEQIVEAMKKRGIAHEYMLFQNEGHGFAKPENRLTFFRAAETFLAKHMGMDQ